MSRLTINSNIASLNAQRNFATATKKLSESYTRLSSGLRINRAVDDAAGLSISESLKADVRLYNQGVRNLNDGVSLLNIADGALGELSSIAIRLNELAEQSANGTLGNKQRQALDKEAQSLSKEYNRIARTTEFNGRKIFDGDFGDLSLAAGGSSSSLIVGDLGGAIGDGTFEARQSFATGTNPTGLTVGDFNGDGISDLVSADLSSNRLSVFLGNGNGSFSARLSFSTGVNPTAVTVGDFNGDGISDLVSADQSDNRLSVFLGNGDGSFSTRQSYVTGSVPRSVTVGDFNGDGLLDLLSGDYSSNSLSVLLGNGNGSFSAGRSFQTGALPYWVKTGDFNGDGRSDLVSADYNDNRLSVFIANGDGSFSARQSFVTGTNPRTVMVGDFNGD
jgi:flagellin-like hook-associated protein FlgL